MKKWLCAFFSLIVMLSIATTCFAATSVTLPEDTTYDANIFVAPGNSSLMKAYSNVISDRNAAETDRLKEQYKQYYASILPADYLELGGTTVLTDPIAAYVDANGDPVAVWNLPPLTEGYYYVLAANNYLAMPDYTYPVLVLTKKPLVAQDVLLRIYRRSDDQQMGQFVMQVLPSITSLAVEDPHMDESGSLGVANAGIKGRTWAFEYQGWYRPFQTLFATFGPDFVVAKKEEPHDTDIYELNPEDEEDNPASLIMSKKSDSQQVKEYKYSYTHYEGFLSEEVLDSDDKTTTLDVYKAYADEDQGRLTYTLGTKSGIELGVIKDNHTSGRIRTSDNSYQIKNGTEMAFYTNEACHIVYVDPKEVTDAYAGIYRVEDDDIKQLPLNQEYDLRVMANDYYLPFIFDEPGTDDESDCFDLLSLDNGAPGIKAVKAFTEYHNLAAIHCWNAWKATVGGIEYAGDKTYTLTFETNGGTACNDITMPVKSKESIQLPSTTREDYKFVGWYTDPQLTSLYDQTTFEVEAGGQYTLYAKWRQDLGTYQVTFYNDQKNTRNTEPFYIPNQPTLPSTPQGVNGTNFKAWVILDENGTELSTYYPSIFQPVKNTRYTFKTTWSTKGTITDVQLKKKKYTVGESVNTNDVIITITEDDGTTRKLGSEEYTIYPSSFTTPGTVSVVFTYVAGASQASVDVNVEEDSCTGISAEYTGGKVRVGKKIDPKKVNVTAKYASGREVQIYNFTLKPLKIESEGSNSITVKALNQETTITVEGKAKADELGDSDDDDDSSSDTDTLDKAISISAVYEGDTVALDGAINPNDFSVMALLNDGTSVSLTSADFSINPKYATTPPNTSVTVSFRTMNYTVLVPTSTERESDDDEDYSPGTGDDDETDTSDSDSSYDNEDYDNDSGDNSSSSDNQSQTSSYYLHGHNIFDDFMSFGASQPISDVDINQIIDDTPEGTESQTVALVNDSIGNSVTVDMLNKIKDKGTVFEFDMTDDNGVVLGKWTVDPSKITTVSYDFAPTINAKKYYRHTDEVCVGYSVENLPEYATLQVDTSKFIPSGTDFEYYVLGAPDTTASDPNAHRTDSQVGDYMEVSDQYFAITTHTGEYYPTDFNLENDIAWPSEENTTEISEGTTTGSGDGTSTGTDTGADTSAGNVDGPNVHDSGNIQQETPLIKKLLPVIAGGVVLLLLAAVAILIIMKRRNTSNSTPQFNEEDIDIPEDTGDEDEDELELDEDNSDDDDWA